MAFDLAAVLVLEGEMEQRFDTDLLYFRTDGDRSQGRMAAGVVGDGQGLYPAVFPGPGGKLQEIVHAAAARSLAGNEFVGDGEFVRVEEGPGEFVLRWHGSRVSVR